MVNNTAEKKMTERNEVVEVAGQIMKTMVVFKVQVTKNPHGVVSRCVATLSDDKEIEIPTMYASWAMTVAKVYELQKQATESHVDTGFVPLVKALRAAVVIVKAYEEVMQTWEEFYAPATVQITESE
jgi:catalase (peroxidase I)